MPHAASQHTQELCPSGFGGRGSGRGQSQGDTPKVACREAPALPALSAASLLSPQHGQHGDSEATWSPHSREPHGENQNQLPRYPHG